MNIALIGYGKMGKVIEEIAVSRGHKIVGRCTSQSPVEEINFEEADVAIEFTAPHMAIKHIEFCVELYREQIRTDAAFCTSIQRTRHRGRSRSSRSY